MRFFRCFVVLTLCIGWGFGMQAVAAEEKATPEEIIARIREAAAFLSEKGEAGLSEFENKDSRWVWKDTYLFIHDCQKGITVAHPVSSRQVGRRNIGIRDVRGNMFFIQGCEVANNPEGGWIEYWWPKPGEEKPSRKISYMYRIPGTSWDLGAGIYDEEITIETLNRLLKK